MKTKLFLLLTVLFVLSTQAQNLTIKGRVTDTSQEAIIAANVSLWTTDSTLVTGVTSDTQGKFALNKIKAGNYRLAITFIGYQSEVILLKLNNNLDLGDVQLQEDAVSLGEVTVSASNVLQRVDRQIILPTESQLKRSFGAYDLLNNLGIARLQVDKFTNSMSISGGGAVQTRINGIKAVSYTHLDVYKRQEYEVVANNWEHSYTREKAAYPIESVRENKFWINVARVDNTLGDRKLLPTCYGCFE